MSRRGFLRGVAAIGLMPESLFAAEPALPGPLQALRETLRRPLPSRFTAKSKLTWPGGVVSGQYEYRGSPERCAIRGSLISVGRLQGAPNTEHAHRIVLYGGTWVDEKLGVDPEPGPGHDALVIESSRTRSEDKPQTPPRFVVRASRTTEFEPRASLAGIGIAFGYRDRAVFPELWASHPDEQVTVRPEREPIDGVETVVVQFLSGAQRRTLWLDSRQGMLPRQIEILDLDSSGERVGGAHRFTENFRDDFPHGRRAFYSGFRFKTVGGQPWITGFQAEFEGDDLEWKPCTLRGEYQVDAIQLDAVPPTEEDLEAAIEFPEETRVEVQVELPDGRGSRTGLWKEGRVQPGAGGGFF